MCRSPPGRVALLGAIGFEHLGHTGAAAANISGYASVWRIFLVELPIPTTFNRPFDVERLCQPPASGAVTRFRFALVWAAVSVTKRTPRPARFATLVQSVLDEKEIGVRPRFCGDSPVATRPGDVAVRLAANPEISTPRAMTRR
jgi:hypothetical protein